MSSIHLCFTEKKNWNDTKISKFKAAGLIRKKKVVRKKIFAILKSTCTVKAFLWPHASWLNIAES